MKADEIFLAAVEKKTPGERAALVDGACGENAELRAQVEGLLKSHEAAGSFLEQPLFDSSPTVDPPAIAEGPGTVIGLYKLLQQIGEGGMGVVFMAEQQHPVRRKVALKVIKLGMDTRQVIARFEAERQALAMMDHVNIARVLDVGATDTGRPYFVMDLVHGVPITKYCDDNHLTPRERLELFVPVCQAIQHAHQKGIIHRDVKPSNILVTMYDGKPVPKVIDFGVAKATEQALTERTMFTQYGTIVGTLEYMPPEQAEMSGLGVDTRSDIYALGVLLYELLTGSTPLERPRLREAAYAEVLRLIREEEAPRPSTRLSSSDTLPAIAAARKTEPAKLARLVRGELDWIVMKALEKDRTRRYETASAFAADVQRYLDDETVQACPPSAWYRFRKFARRSKKALATAGLVSVALVLAVVALAVGNVRVRRERDQKEEALTAAKANFQLARSAVDRYFTRVSDSKPLRAHGLEKLRRDLLQDARDYYEQFIKEQAEDPGLQTERGDAYMHLGTINEEMGSNAEAMRSFQQAEEIFGKLAQQHTDDLALLIRWAGSLHELTIIYQITGKMEDARATYEKLLPIRERLAKAQPEEAKYQNSLAGTLTNLGLLYVDTNQPAKAQAAYQRALSIFEQLSRAYPGEPRYLANQVAVLSNAGSAYHASGELRRARTLGERARDISESLLRDFPREIKYQYGLGKSLSGLGFDYLELGEIDMSSRAYQRSLSIFTQLAREHSDVPEYQEMRGRNLGDLGLVRSRQGQQGEAQKSFEESLKIFEDLRRQVPDNRDYPDNVAIALENLGALQRCMGRLADSRANYEKALTLREQLVKEHPESSDFQMKLAVVRLGLIAARASTSDHKNACGDAEELLKNGPQSRLVLYSAAMVYCYAAGAVQQDPNLSESDRRDLRKTRTARAVELLHEAVDQGYRDIQNLKVDPDIDPLRSDPTFKRLISDLEQRAKASDRN